jgi:aminopeptidase-like protein
MWITRFEIFTGDYDERQYFPGSAFLSACSRGHHMAASRSATSADNLDFIDRAALADSLDTIWRLSRSWKVIGRTPIWVRNASRNSDVAVCASMGGHGGGEFGEAACYGAEPSDGHQSLLDITERSKLSHAIQRGVCACERRPAQKSC